MSAFAGGPDAPITDARYWELVEAERRIERVRGVMAELRLLSDNHSKRFAPYNDGARDAYGTAATMLSAALRGKEDASGGSAGGRPEAGEEERGG